MSDVLYVLSVCGPLVLTAKREFQLVAVNCTGHSLEAMTPLERIGYTTGEGLNRLTMAKRFGYKIYSAGKQQAKTRDLNEVQDAQLALELERYLAVVERSFFIEELRPALYPIKMVTDLFTVRSTYILPGLNVLDLVADLVRHADVLMRDGLGDAELRLPSVELSLNADSTSPSISAARLVLDYFEAAVAAFCKAQVVAVVSRVEELRKEI